MTVRAGYISQPMEAAPGHSEFHGTVVTWCRNVLLECPKGVRFHRKCVHKHKQHTEEWIYTWIILSWTSRNQLFFLPLPVLHVTPFPLTQANSTCATAARPWFQQSWRLDGLEVEWRLVKTCFESVESSLRVSVRQAGIPWATGLDAEEADA